MGTPPGKSTADEIVEGAVRDLSDAGLTNQGGLRVLTCGDTMWQAGTTALGQRLLSFVTSPNAFGDGR